MTNPIITNNDTQGVILFNPEFKQDLVDFQAAQTHYEGELLGRKGVSDTVTATPDGGNTGDGTCTALALAAGAKQLVGAYNLECVEAIANGGRFKLEDPNGRLITDQLIMTAGAGAATVFEAGGLRFTLTDGATDFALADKFAVTTTEDGALYLYDRDAVDGREIIVSLFVPDERTEASAATYPHMVLIGGEVRKAKIEEAMTAATAGAWTMTKAEIDFLQTIGLVVRPEVTLTELDNQ